MKIAIIGRSELLFETAELLVKKGFEIPLVITSKAAPEYKKKEQDFKGFADPVQINNWLPGNVEAWSMVRYSN